MQQRMAGLTRILEENSKEEGVEQRMTVKQAEGTEDGPEKNVDNEEPFQAVNIESNVTRPK